MRTVRSLQRITYSKYFCSGEHSDQIDRFDVRAHLDTVPAEKKGDNDIDAEFEKDELSEVMYERYREIIHNDFRGLGNRSKRNSFNNVIVPIIT